MGFSAESHSSLYFTVSYNYYCTAAHISHPGYVETLIQNDHAHATLDFQRNQFVWTSGLSRLRMSAQTADFSFQKLPADSNYITSIVQTEADLLAITLEYIYKPGILLFSPPSDHLIKCHYHSSALEALL